MKFMVAGKKFENAVDAYNDAVGRGLPLRYSYHGVNYRWVRCNYEDLPRSYLAKQRANFLLSSITRVRDRVWYNKPLDNVVECYGSGRHDFAIHDIIPDENFLAYLSKTEEEVKSTMHEGIN